MQLAPVAVHQFRQIRLEDDGALFGDHHVFTSSLWGKVKECTAVFESFTPAVREQFQLDQHNLVFLIELKITRSCVFVSTSVFLCPSNKKRDLVQ